MVIMLFPALLIMGINGVISVVEIVLEKVLTIVVRSEHTVEVVACWIFVIVLVDEIVTWNLPQSRLVTVNHCGEPVHQKVCNVITILRESSFYL